MNQELLDYLDSLPPLHKSQTPFLSRVIKSLWKTIYLLITTLLMLSLLLVYLSMIVGAIYAIYYFFMNPIYSPSTDSNSNPFRQFGFAIFINLGPPIFFLCLIFILCRPFFMKKKSPTIEERISPDREPMLFAFVERICRLVGSAPPEAVYINNSVGASVRYRDGLRGMLKSQRALIIGLPLVRGVHQQSLAALLARELSLYSNPLHARLETIIRWIHDWSSHAIDYRIWIDEIQNVGSVWVRILAISFIMPWFVLWVLIKTCSLFASMALRQSDLEADRMAIMLEGSKMYVLTLRRVFSLLQNEDYTWQDNYNLFLRPRRLAKDWSAFVLSNSEQNKEYSQRAFEEKLSTEKTSWFSSMPSLRSRVRAATRLNQKGVFHYRKAAIQLFSNFNQTSSRHTKHHYEKTVDLRSSGTVVASAHEIIQPRKAINVPPSAGNRFFMETLSTVRPLRLATGIENESINIHTLATELKAVRGRLEAMHKDYKISLDAETESLARELKLKQGLVLLHTGIEIKPSNYGVFKASEQLIHDEVTKLIHGGKKRRETMKAFEHCMRTRLQCCIQLFMNTESAQSDNWRNSISGEILTLLPAAEACSSTMNTILDIRTLQSECYALLQWNEDYQNKSNYIEALYGRLNSLHSSLKAMLRPLETEPYPFNGEPSIRQYVFGEIPPPNSIDTLNASYEMVNRIHDLYFRVFGRLAAIAEEVEAAVDLQPIPYTKKEPAKA